MSFPSEKEIKKVRSKLDKSDPTRILPKNASRAERVKYELCKKFVSHILESGVSQKELAERLNMDPARLNEIIKYKIDLFTIDKLIEYAEKLDPKLSISVA